MLTELSIENLILIEKSTLQFPSGFLVITGETGAGKSVFLSALKLLGGQKATSKLIRQGCDKARVEGTFEIKSKALTEILQEAEIDFEEDLIIEREFYASGKSRIRCNGHIIPLKFLQKIGPLLLQLHGQSEQTLLKDTSTHAKLLDEFIDFDPSYTQQLKKTKVKQVELSQLQQKFSQLESQADFIKFQHNELHRIELKPNEDEELRQKLETLEASSKLGAHKQDAIAYLSAFSTQLQEMQRPLQSLENITQKNFSPQLQALLDAHNLLEQEVEDIEILENVSSFELDKYNSRLAKLQSAQRKFRCDQNGLLALYEQRSQEIELLQNFQSEAELLKKEFEYEFQILISSAQALHQQRLQAAKSLDEQISAQLQKLGMKEASFHTIVDFPEAPTWQQVGSKGLDQVEFHVSPNLGEGMGPLSKTLSGGELSRVMLALKNVLAHRDLVPTLVFDEVDSGISGEVGHSIGQCLSDLAKHHQVIVISHLHQVACIAPSHFEVCKQTEEDRTTTKITPLNQQTRIVEVARMLGGRNDSKAIEHATTLLAHHE